MVHFIALLAPINILSIGCATRRYKAREISDHALSATGGNTGSVSSIPASSLDPRLPLTSPQGISRGVVYRLALSRPSVFKRT